MASVADGTSSKKDRTEELMEQIKVLNAKYEADLKYWDGYKQSKIDQATKEYVAAVELLKKKHEEDLANLNKSLIDAKANHYHKLTFCSVSGKFIGVGKNELEMTKEAIVFSLSWALGDKFRLVTEPIGAPPQFVRLIKGKKGAVALLSDDDKLALCDNDAAATLFYFENIVTIDNRHFQAHIKIDQDTHLYLGRGAMGNDKLKIGQKDKQERDIFTITVIE